MLGSNLAVRARRVVAGGGLPGKDRYAAALALVNSSPVAANPVLGVDRPRFSHAKGGRSLSLPSTPLLP